MIQIKVYLDDGRIFEYEVADAAKGREHASAIISGGYRHNPGSEYLEHYPPWRILKVKLVGDIPTSYPDKVTGT
jgi:hypothetical protein